MGCFYTLPNLLVESKNASERSIAQLKSTLLKLRLLYILAKKKLKTTSFSENAILPYFNQLSEILSPTILWFVFFMVKVVIKVKHTANIGRIFETNFISKRTYCRTTAAYSSTKVKLFFSLHSLK